MSVGRIAPNFLDPKRAAQAALCYTPNMERLRFFVLVAAVLTFAISVPFSVNRAAQCPCAASAPCHCPLVDCKLLPASGSSCHCSVSALCSAVIFDLAAGAGPSAWSTPARLDPHGLRLVPPLRPPIPETPFAA
jgi:hypothetical protein